jgi:hypothetical protein
LFGHKSLAQIQGVEYTAPLRSECENRKIVLFLSTVTDAYQTALPGGWLVLEEPDFTCARAIAGTAQAREAFAKVADSICSMFKKRSLDPARGSALPEVLQQHGLEHLIVGNDTEQVPGGSDLATVMRLSSVQLEQKYLETGVTATDLNHYRAFCDDPSESAVYYAVIGVVGQKSAPANLMLTL